MELNLNDYLELTSILLLTLSILIAARQLYQIRKTQKENYDWNKRIETQKACAEYDYHLVHDRKELAEKLDYGKTIERIPAAKFEEIFNMNLSLRINCHNLLNYFDSLCIGLENKVYDEQIIKDNFKALIIRTYDQFKPYIDSRNCLDDNCFCETMKMYVHKWSKNKKEEREDVVK